MKLSPQNESINQTVADPGFDLRGRGHKFFNGGGDRKT